MWPDRRLIDPLQIEYPIVLAPMAGIGTGELAASVWATGGFGSIACAAMKPELVAKTIQAFRRLTVNQSTLTSLVMYRQKQMLTANRLGVTGCRRTTASLGFTPSCRTRALSASRTSFDRTFTISYSDVGCFNC
jgi:NAD(P)H-dependent flavin oxidoreductase YrpB (nitropropane dioxygenase family)